MLAANVSAGEVIAKEGSCPHISTSLIRFLLLKDRHRLDLHTMSANSSTPKQGTRKEEQKQATDASKDATATNEVTHEDKARLSNENSKDSRVEEEDEELSDLSPAQKEMASKVKEAAAKRGRDTGTPPPPLQNSFNPIQHQPNYIKVKHKSDEPDDDFN